MPRQAVNIRAVRNTSDKSEVCFIDKSPDVKYCPAGFMFDESAGQLF